MTEGNCCYLNVFFSKIFDLNKLIVKPTSFIYSKTLLEIEQENPISFIIAVFFAILVYIDSIERLELTIHQFIFHFKELIFEKVWQGLAFAVEIPELDLVSVVNA